MRTALFLQSPNKDRADPDAESPSPSSQLAKAEKKVQELMEQGSVLKKVRTVLQKQYFHIHTVQKVGSHGIHTTVLPSSGRAPTRRALACPWR